MQKTLIQNLSTNDVYMFSDDDLRMVIKHSVEQAFDLSKAKTEELFLKLIPSDMMREGGFQITNKSDFMKGAAVATLYMSSNMVEVALEVQGGGKLSQNLLDYKTQLQEEYSKKLCLYFDIEH